MQPLAREQTAHEGLPGARPWWRDWGAWWRFTRRLAALVLAMTAGMAVLAVAVAAVSPLPGSHHPLISYTWMSAFMAAPMVAWMRLRGYTWADGAEMTAAMYLPIFALVLPVQLGFTLPGLSALSLMILTHVATLVGMAALMVYRWDRYAGGPRRR